MQLIIDGGGTKLIEEFSKEHKMTPLPQSLKSSRVFGEVCDYCHTSFGGEKELLKKKELPLIDEYNGHSSIARLFEYGYQRIWLSNYYPLKKVATYSHKSFF